MKTSPRASKRLAVTAAAAAALTLVRAGAVENADLRLDTTRNLFSVCSVTAGAPEYLVARQACRAFIEGVAQYHDLVSKPPKLKRLFCPPPNATVGEAVTIFGEWASTRTGDVKLMGEPPALGVVRAMAAKYPCTGR